MQENDRLIQDFYGRQTKEDVEKISTSFSIASSTQNVRLTISGKYRMRVKNFIALKNEQLIIYPKLYVSPKKGSLILTIMLETVDYTDKVLQGSTILHNLALVPREGSSKELYLNTARMVKPQLFALTGCKDLDLSNPQKTIKELTFSYINENGKFTITKDHIMKNEVMVDIIDGWYNNAPKVQVNGGSIRMALANDKSQSNTVPISVVDKGMDFQESDIDPVIGIGPSGVVDDDVIATEPF
jgi:hypothetical protein